MNRPDHWLEDLQHQAGAWSLPPDEVRRRARSLPGGTPAPVLEDQRFSDRPLDIRGDTATVDGTGQIVAAAGEQGELSVAISAPEPGRVRLEGQVWLDDDADSPIFVYLAHRDHIVSELRVGDGDMFRLDEPVAPGWHLDVVLPSGECLRVEDPR